MKVLTHLLSAPLPRSVVGMAAGAAAVPSTGAFAVSEASAVSTAEGSSSAASIESRGGCVGSVAGDVLVYEDGYVSVGSVYARVYGNVCSCISLLSI